MANISHGMNVEEVRNLSNTLRQKSQEILQITQQLGSLVQNTTWVGPDANNFKGPWWDGHRSHLQAIAKDLEGFADSAKNNAQEQENVSNH